jgi:WD40 repeat protein
MKYLILIICLITGALHAGQDTSSIPLDHEQDPLKQALRPFFPDNQTINLISCYLAKKQDTFEENTQKYIPNSIFSVQDIRALTMAYAGNFGQYEYAFHQVNREGSIVEMVFSPDGTYCAIGTMYIQDDYRICLYKLPELVLVKKYYLDTNGKSKKLLHKLSFNNQGNIEYALTGVFNGQTTYHAIDLQTHKKTSLNHSPLLSLIGSKNTVKLLNDKTIDLNKSGAQLIAYSAQGKYIAYLDQERNVQVFDTFENKIIRSFKPTIKVYDYNEENLYCQLAFSPNEQYLILLNQKQYHVWDIAQDKLLYSNSMSEEDVVIPNFISLAFSLREPIFALCTDTDSQIANSKYMIQLLNIQTGECLHILYPDKEEQIKDIRFSPSGSYLIAGCYSGNFIVWKNTFYGEVAKQQETMRPVVSGILSRLYSAVARWI